MEGATSSFEGVLTDFLTPILPKINVEPTREGLIDLHWLVIENTVSVVPNLGGGRHRHIVLTMTAKEYRSQTGFFCAAAQPWRLPIEHGERPRTSAWKWKVPTKLSTIFQIYRHRRSLKNQIVTAVEQVFLSPLVDQLTGFGQMSTLTIIRHIFSIYRVINKIDLEENAVKMMGTYDPSEPFSWLIERF